MAIFRVEKNNNYTVMSNVHLRDASLTLKAKGLLSLMLSLPEAWDYTLSGLAAICREGVDAIRTAVQELEQAGYISRRRTQDESGKFAGNEYIIHESPQPSLENPTMEEIAPSLENPMMEEAAPLLDFPLLDNPSLENPTELNKDRSSKDLKKKIEKKKPPRCSLSDEQLGSLLAQGIQTMASPAWTAQEKNGLYLLLMELYSPNRAVRKARPMRTEASVRRTLSLLAKFPDPAAMAECLQEAIANGWQGIHPPKAPPAPQTGEVKRTWI